MTEEENHQQEETLETPSDETETPPQFLIERMKEDFAKKSRRDLEAPEETADEE